ncbi:RNA-binding protein [Lachnospiraceae bacterium NE2001]|jgi:RNA-binding protein|nr:RNA-binding protein [Lachnospiraceae bacterium NE2001]
MTTKERAYLKGLAQTIDPVLSLGKASLTPEFVEATSEALRARELIKVNVLKNCIDDPGSLAITLGERTRSEVVQVIGRKIVLYKRNQDNIKIVFPGEKIKTAKK